MSIELIIRPATDADRDFVLHLAERLATFELPRWRTEAEVVDGDRRALSTWFDAPDRPGEAVLIAELDRERVGAAYLVTLTDYFHRRSHGHVSVLAVSEHVEGRGVGTALLDAATRWSCEHGFDRLTLSVFAGNHRAQRVYERHGFAPETLRYVKPL